MTRGGVEIGSGSGQPTVATCVPSAFSTTNPSRCDPSTQKYLPSQAHWTEPLPLTGISSSSPFCRMMKTDWNPTATSRPSPAVLRRTDVAIASLLCVIACPVDKLPVGLPHSKRYMLLHNGRPGRQRHLLARLGGLPAGRTSPCSLHIVPTLPDISQDWTIVALARWRTPGSRGCGPPGAAGLPAARWRCTAGRATGHIGLSTANPRRWPEAPDGRSSSGAQQTHPCPRGWPHQDPDRRRVAPSSKSRCP